MIQILGWVAVGGIVTATLLAVAPVAVALGLVPLALVLRGMWRDLRGGKLPPSAAQSVQRPAGRTAADLLTRVTAAVQIDVAELSQGPSNARRVHGVPARGQLPTKFDDVPHPGVFATLEGDVQLSSS